MRMFSLVAIASNQIFAFFQVCELPWGWKKVNDLRALIIMPCCQFLHLLNLFHSCFVDSNEILCRNSSLTSIKDKLFMRVLYQKRAMLSNNCNGKSPPFRVWHLVNSFLKLQFRHKICIHWLQNEFSEPLCQMTCAICSTSLCNFWGSVMPPWFWLDNWWDSCGRTFVGVWIQK